MKKILGLFFVLVCGIQSAYAGGAVEGKVKKIAIDRTYTTAKAFVTVAGDKSNTPACHTNRSWSFALPLVTDLDRAVYSMLLSAHATGKTALLEGRGLCDVHSSIETLTYVNH